MKSESILKPPISAILKCGKVSLLPNESVGEHITDKREEVIIVVKGTATLRKGEKTFIIHENETHFIPEGTVHNVLNNSSESLEYYYVVSLLEVKS